MAEEGGTVIVTGAAGGLGRSIAEQYIKLTKPYDAQFTVRNAAHANAAPLRQLLGDDPRFSTPELALDSLAAVRQFTSKLNTDIAAGRAKPIRALVLNAAVQSTIGVRYTSDGLEESFAVNYLANFLLVLLLLQSMDKDHGRIVFVSSFSHDSALSINQGHAPEKLAWKDPEELAKPTTKDAKGDEWAAGMRRYAASKLWLLMFTYELQRRLDANPTLHNISVLSIEPGGMPNTGIQRSSPWHIRFVVFPLLRAYVAGAQYIAPNGLFRSTRKSAQDVLNACFQEDAPISQYPKAMYLSGSKTSQSSTESRDEEKQKRLWDGSLKLAGLEEAETALGASGGDQPTVA